MNLMRRSQRGELKRAVAKISERRVSMVGSIGEEASSSSESERSLDGTDIRSLDGTDKRFERPIGDCL